jgi:hypothetical protein
MVIAGVLLSGLSAPDHAVHMFTNPAHGEFAFLVPLGGTRFRCYSGFYQEKGRRWLSGGRSIVDFVASSVAIGAPREWFEGIVNLAAEHILWYHRRHDNSIILALIQGLSISCRDHLSRGLAVLSILPQLS